MPRLNNTNQWVNDRLKKTAIVWKAISPTGDATNDLGFIDVEANTHHRWILKLEGKNGYMITLRGKNKAGKIKPIEFANLTKVKDFIDIIDRANMRII